MEFQCITLEDVPAGHPIEVFYRHWRKFLVPGRVITRAQFNPFDFTCVIPWIVILEKCLREGRAAYRYRLCGSGCVELFQHDATGGYFGDHLPESYKQERMDEFREAEETLSPILSHHELAMAGREHVVVLRGIFPVASHEGRVDQIFGIFAVAEQRCPHFCAH